MLRPEVGMSSIRWLDVSWSNLSNRSLEALADAGARLPELETLNICSTRITDAGLKALGRSSAGLGSLRTLYLHYNHSLSDVGIAAIASADTSLKGLREVSIDGTKVTDAGVDMLRRRFPGIKVTPQDDQVDRKWR